MFSLNDSMRYWLYTEPTDMRKSFHTLSGLVRDRMERNPLDGDVYIFINRHRNRMKLLHWEPGGLVLYAKMLERGTFGKPRGLQSDGSLAWRDLVLAEIILGKFLYHLPFYRQINRFREFGLRLPASTVGDWYEKSVESLNVIYKLLRRQVMASEYIQVDESVVPVLDNEKHKARKGYEWRVRDGLTGSLFFWYDRGSRSKKTAKELLGGYCGTFQSDGYEAYEQFCGVNGVIGAACWAHARRKFVDALKENQKLATQAIVMIGKLYEVERKAEEAAMTPGQRKELRQKEAYPVIQLMERWCVDTYAEVLESSLVGKAIAYTYSLMDRLAVYVNDGRINIDNNLIENAIRPLALGRKNWLFCGNDASAYRAAIVYSLLASCRAANIDPRQWLERVLVEIPARKKSGLPMDDLLPMEYSRRPDAKPWNLPDPD